MVKVPEVNVVRAADDFKSGKLDLLFFAVGAPKVAEVAASVGGLRVLPMNPFPDSEKRMKTVREEYYFSTVNPAPHIAGVDKPSQVQTIDVVVAVGAHVRDEVVYSSSRRCGRTRSGLVAGHPNFNQFDEKQAGKPQPRPAAPPGRDQVLQGSRHLERITGNQHETSSQSSPPRSPRPRSAGLAAAQTYGLATLPPGALQNALGSVIGKVVQDHSKMQMRVQGYGGDAGVLDAAASKSSDFFALDVTEAADAYLGRGNWNGKKRPTLRSAITMLSFQAAVFVRKDSPIQSLADLKGKRVPGVWAQQTGVLQMMTGTLADGEPHLQGRAVLPGGERGARRRRLQVGQARHLLLRGGRAEGGGGGGQHPGRRAGHSLRNQRPKR